MPAPGSKSENNWNRMSKCHGSDGPIDKKVFIYRLKPETFESKSKNL